nr:hypothetical protein HmN_000982600 [Hymenolepis microstoma]
MKTQSFISVLVFGFILMEMTSGAENNGKSDTGADGGGDTGKNTEKPSGDGENSGNGNIAIETTTLASTNITPYFALSAVSFLISLASKI